MKQLKMPKFKNEAEEAEWWYRNRKTVEARLLNAKKTLAVSEIIERENRSQAISIRLPVADIELAKQRAKEKGIGYQILLKMLLHESLQQSAKV